MVVMNGMIAERIQRTKKITTLTKIAAEHIIMNKEMVEQQEESIDVPKAMNLPPVTVITVVAEPEAMNLSHSKEYHQITDNSTTSNVPSSKILLAIPESKGSKKYKTYLGLVDSGSSGSLVNEKLVEFANFSMQLQKKPIKWDTATGTFQTD
jgi:hypothetical protein